MIVFDVDGTLIGGESTDWASFDAAFAEAAGFALPEHFFSEIEEVTAQAIVHQALFTRSHHEKQRIERAVADGYVRRLREAHERDPLCFPAMAGAVRLLHDLRERGILVAIATGDWRESITFKLAASGIPFEDLPLVSSSEYHCRRDIIAAAVEQAGGSLEEAVYVGDGVWDLRACRQLGIPFVGVGSRRDKLRDAGANYILDDLRPASFWSVHQIIKCNRK
jgi:phosphoglycolate phosphatase-like HAD superfamily hydrolase